MSTRPAAASTICVKVACAPPARMKLPSWTARTRSAAGLNVIVSDSPESRDAFVADTATVYGPPPTRNSGPGGVTTICAPALAIAGFGLVAVAPAGAAGIAAGVAAEGAGGGTPAAGTPCGVAAPGTAGPAPPPQQSYPESANYPAE